MTVLELPRPLLDDGAHRAPVRLRLVEGSGEPAGPAPAPARRRASHRVPLEVRRRRTLLALMGLLLGVLALPLGGAGGPSHAPGSAPAGLLRPADYVVRPGDTLWTIAERAEPGADPRPLVDRLAAQLGTDTVEPGEQIALP